MEQVLVRQLAGLPDVRSEDLVYVAHQEVVAVLTVDQPHVHPVAVVAV
jgi:hypothetical protein